MKTTARALHSPQVSQVPNSTLDRRRFLATAAFAAAGAALAPKTSAAERDWSGNNPVRYPDPDIIVLDQRFAKY